MCGPFVRQPPAALLQLQLQHAAQAQAQAQYKPVGVGGLPQNGLPEPVSLPANQAFGFNQEFPVGQPYPLESLPAPAADNKAVFNWNLLDEAFGDLDGPALTAAATPVGNDVFGFSPQPIGASPALEGASQEVCFDSLPGTTAPAPQPRVAVKVEKEAVVRRPPKERKPPRAPAKQLSDSDGDLEAECKPYSEKLPKELLDHPCAATLLSAGIRIKGRTHEELLEVAERIKKRRRASAARCRARKATHVHHLEEENNDLKAENMKLRQRIAELTGGTMDLNSFFGLDTSLCPPAPETFTF